MPSQQYYRRQARLCFQMALACGGPTRAAQLQAQGRVYLDLARQVRQTTDLNSVLEEFNAGQMRKRGPDGSPHRG
jgi:hypothetical protein